jgi:hypothetical protein
MTTTMTQPLTALAVANERRLQRSAARLRVANAPDTAAGMVVLAGELDAGHTWPKALRVEEALGWPRRSTSRHRQALLWHVGLSETRTVQTLTAREVGVLCDALRSPALWRGRA